MSETETKLRSALKSLVAAGERVTISGVARAVGVSPALIHNRYPTLAQEIRAKDSYRKSKSTHDLRQELRAEISKNKLLMEEYRKLEEDFRKLSSANEALRVRLAEAEAITRSKNVFPIGPSGGE